MESSQKVSSGCLVSSGTSGAPVAGQGTQNQEVHASCESTVMETLRAGHAIDLVTFTLTSCDKL